MEPSPSLAAAARDPLSFLPGVAEQLDYYVYALVDPRDDAIFYVGKGKGDRVYQHARHAKKVDLSASRAELKLAQIQEIHRLGLEVRVEIIRHRLGEEVAFQVESAVMDAFLISGKDLTNKVSGHGADRRWRPLADIVAGYVATDVEIDLKDRVALIRISRLFNHELTADELYEKTRQWWRITPGRAEYAFAVYNGIVRAVYRIDPDKWVVWGHPPNQPVDRRMTGRRAFFGERDLVLEERYVWRDVSRYLVRGAQNPIKYVNC
ncbi:MAG TPA: hypothetical protein VGO31_15550 [Microbacteriaceae bacterium]|jgi:hypothetical protein|nr:hypothetical protein [Microbacteriaceae bacterium]